MALTADSISQQIANKIATATTIQKSNIYQYEPQGGFTGYPAVTITLKNFEEKFADTARYEEHYMFSIKIYNEWIEQGSATSESQFRATANEIKTILNADPTLGGFMVSGYTRTETGQPSWMKGPNIVERVMELVLNAWVIQ